MNFTKNILSKLFARWMNDNGVSEEYLDTVLQNTLSPKGFLWDFFWRRAVDVHSDRVAMRRNIVLSMPDRDASQYAEELEMLKKLPNGRWSPFLYAKVREAKDHEAGYDRKLRLPFVVHNCHRLYFPKWMTTDEALKAYRYFLEEEGITGDGLYAKSPHCYQTPDFKVDDGDIVLDIGCSEALFALDVVERAAEVYAFETLRHWRKPNMATFAPFGEKVHIVNKFVGGETKGSMTRLEDAVKGCPADATFFMKMDIEGGERTVIESSEQFLRSHKVKLACAAYHRQDDATWLAEKLKEIGFMVFFSDGYMLPLMKDFTYPYFRKTIIYAQNFNCTTNR